MDHGVASGLALMVPWPFARCRPAVLSHGSLDPPEVTVGADVVGAGEAGETIGTYKKFTINK